MSAPSGKAENIENISGSTEADIARFRHRAKRAEPIKSMCPELGVRSPPDQNRDDAPEDCLYPLIA
jgi:hypothetical protein